MLIIILVTCSQIIILLYTLLWQLQILLGILQYAATPPSQRASNTFPCLVCVCSKLWPPPPVESSQIQPWCRPYLLRKTFYTLHILLSASVSYLMILIHYCTMICLARCLQQNDWRFMKVLLLWCIVFVVLTKKFSSCSLLKKSYVYIFACQSAMNFIFWTIFLLLYFKGASSGL